ncbi:MAG: adenylosuccinate synthase [Blastochloris sp.]|nr:adenylosuccinate synthase [Blastochloris sp.]
MNTVLVGSQWGDEGKGKIIDFLMETHDAVVRSQGGNNAGHTVEVGSEKFVLHLVPSGILRKGKLCLIGHGTVIDPGSLVKEIQGLESRGVKTLGRLFVSDRAHVVMPYHRHLDAGRETAAKGKMIGTTKRGIGPTYGDKIARTGLRMHDLLDEAALAEKIKERVKEVNQFCRLKGWETVSATRILKEYRAAAQILKPYITDTIAKVHELLEKKKSMLFEGAQGTFLDIDCGTYPYVTSSNTTSGGACTGSGLPPNQVHEVIGTLKAYTTRVGEGPFATESPELSDRLHEMGREFGATTGRARRCGWFDAVLVRFATRINGVTQLALTNLDGLDGVKEIRVCVAYKLAGKTLHYPPASIEALARCQPVYKKFPGWLSDTSGCQSFSDLPAQAREYLKALEKLSGAKLSIVSVGPRLPRPFSHEN